MIPFQLHRHIPYVRRPFFQRDEAMRQRDALRAERDALAVEFRGVRDERDRLRAEIASLPRAQEIPFALPPANSDADAGYLWADAAFFASGQINPAQFLEFLAPEPLPAGWMGDFDLQILYNVARRVRGPFLEIGPWIGRSTSAICAGIRDSDDHATIFDVLDFGICGVEEYEARFGYVPDFNQPDHVKGRLGPSITAPGGTMAVLIENLRVNGLLKFTSSICRGDWVSCPHGRKYGFVFIDAVHNEAEAKRHVGKLRDFLLPGALVIADDVIDHEFALLVCHLLGSTDYALTNVMGPSNKLIITRTPKRIAPRCS